MDLFLENEIMMTVAYYSIAMLALIVFLSIFELVTSYSNWEELKRGNVAVALATAGKIFGVANIFRHSIEQSDRILTMLGWSVLGFVLMLISYFIFEFLSPSFKVDEELANNNKAVGLISFILSVGISYVVGASIIAL
ncbi:membrane protein [Alkalihalobacillus alcalophilus ATCC 27647 = CGMCC 1.3604]|uniref:Membrane protein n=1 Tax=Alkalihalobacillus alcalophilus ATCC 27647 = CGMCC 1.3604 TaxID=1218173 RepID=A0A094WQ34_ALKAL|nr:DUF350 domain-containing protein [Alkalihalobacillus alcalophilus]KGA98143.1 membrane protein [Alkalihalobacillus alcalophilus ATCC 27647 = CGMCC 1.3604]MED1563559.1 DUF350 domain-containing protein [Alkalihalobacillus alcalophilus]THG90791.1 membrane protein [Alkalihalobacillus alcalophilus ATCC 27647 = CGMCC 1.3604]